MTQETNAGTGAEAPDSTANAAENKRQLEENLSEELSRLSKNFVEVVRVAWESEQRRQLERDLKAGLNSLSESLEQRFKDVRESEQAREVKHKAEDVAEVVADKVRKNEIAQELGEGLLKGLRLLANQLETLATELQAKSKQPGAKTEEATDIPIKPQQ